MVPSVLDASHRSPRPPLALSLPRGAGQLRIGSNGPRSVVTNARAESPLRLLMPKNHGTAAWVFSTSLGGGIVGGDAIDLDVAVEPGASLYLGTQASTKVYGGRASSQRIRAQVAEAALLVLFPDPVVPFAASRYEQSLDVSVAPGGSVIILDAFTCGRAARGERWAFTRFVTRTFIDVGGAPVVRDATRLEPAHGDVGRRMGPYDAFATLHALGPRAAPLVEALAAVQLPSPAQPGARPRSPGGGARRLESSHAVRGDGIVHRIASSAIDDLVVTVRKRSRSLARILGDDPFARKW